jgi:anti-sigma factor RsiW
MAMTAPKQDERLPEDVELLLPWHAAGTLSRRDAARVEQALANDNELAARFEMVREELGEAIRLNESLGAPSVRAMENLFGKIDAEPARPPTASFNIGAWLTDFVTGFSPRTLAYGATAAALAIVLQAGILAGVFVKESAVGPQLASYQQSEPAGAGAHVRIRFKPQATAADITAFLNENNAFVVDGPARENGFFRVRVSDKAMTPAELSAIVKRIAANPVVDFTVPSAQ